MTREEFERWPYLPEYTVFNPFPNKGNNCTWYAHGRMMQLGYCKYALDSMRYNACTWADSAARGAAVSDVPVEASIAFWESGVFYGSVLGHVAVVEKVLEDGSIIVSDSSSSASAFNIYTIRPDEGKWPTAFIIVPPEQPRSVIFSPGEKVETIVGSLNFRLEGVNQPSLLLEKGTIVEIKDHPGNGIYASKPGSSTSYYYWWYAALEIDGEVKYGWLAQEYLASAAPPEQSDSTDPNSGSNPMPDPGASSEPAADSLPEITVLHGDINGDGVINVLDASLAMRHILVVEVLDDDRLGTADVNDDGLVDISDAVLLMQHSLGLISAFS
ncbi:MAG: CHAP domain-containing protein [Bacillota bacterium]|nr:CHAP domain-containing protein [Bacillota bacterium]